MGEKSQGIGLIFAGIIYIIVDLLLHNLSGEDFGLLTFIGFIPISLGIYRLVSYWSFSSAIKRVSYRTPDRKWLTDINAYLKKATDFQEVQQANEAYYYFKLAVDTYYKYGDYEAFTVFIKNDVIPKMKYIEQRIALLNETANLLGIIRFNEANNLRIMAKFFEDILKYHNMEPQNKSNIDNTE
ncbi:MAG TPA: hypothetical protein VMV49_18475 [Candidatus Deferrimicrobium sp.]|nr:hypothetical protein [Candidatus Deferrimicrobium sp.]